VANRPESLGARLRKARLDAGLSQAELAKLCGMSKPTLSRYENDHVLPSLTTVRRIADALNVSVAELASSNHGEQRMYAALRDRGIEVRSDVEAAEIADLIADLRSNV
jgi:transcriptional regulator with XRE-family HTH domain